MGQFAHALRYMLHDCLPLIVHRDISSKNILLDDESEASVSDFDTAKFLNPDSANWTALAGTYGYLWSGDIGDSYGKTSGRSSGACSSSSSSSSSTALPAHQMPVVDVLDQRISPPTREVAGEVVSVVKVAFVSTNISIYPSSLFFGTIQFLLSGFFSLLSLFYILRFLSSLQKKVLVSPNSRFQRRISRTMTWKAQQCPHAKPQAPPLTTAPSLKSMSPPSPSPPLKWISCGPYSKHSQFSQ